MNDSTQTLSREVHRPEETTIRYSVHGSSSGPTLAFIHGWGCNRNDFDPLMSFLPKEYRVLAVDLAEHGGSRSARDDWSIEEFARDVIAVLDAEGVSRCVVVGHSLGGAVAVEVARQRGDCVDQVVALDALHYLALFPHNDEESTAQAMRPFHEDFEVAVRGLVEGGSPSGFDPALTDAYYRKMVAVRQPGGRGALEGLFRWDMERALSETSQPVTVFAVRSLLSDEAIARFGDRIHFVPVDLGSHHFPAEQPEATARLVEDVVRAQVPRG